MFEKASRMKLRFDTSRGFVTVEDLWDLPLSSKTGRDSLDAIALGLYKQIKDLGDVQSFVDETAKPMNEILQLKFDIVKHIIGIRKEDNAQASKAQASKEKKQFLLQILAQKESEDMQKMSKEDIQKMIDSL